MRAGLKLQQPRALALGPGLRGAASWSRLLEPPRSQVPGLLGAEKPVHSDLLSVQERELWVPLDQPGGRSQFAGVVCSPATPDCRASAEQRGAVAQGTGPIRS